VLEVGPPQRLAAYTQERSASAQGGRILLGRQKNAVYITDRERPGARLLLGPQYDVRDMTLTADGRWAATASFWPDGPAKSLRIWDARTGAHAWDLSLYGATFAQFSPDGRWLATFAYGYGCRLWEVETWKEVHRFGDGYFAFSPDGRLLALSDVAGVIRMVEPATGREVMRVRTPDPSCSPAAFTADGGHFLAISPAAKGIYVWDLRTIRAQLRELGLDWDWPEFPAAPARNGSPRVAIKPGAWEVMIAEPEAAMEVFSVVAALNPLCPEPYYQRARTHSRLGNRSAAAAEYAKFLALAAPDDPRRGRALLVRALHADQHKDYAAAFAHLRDLLQVERAALDFWRPEVATLCNSAAWAFAKSAAKDPSPDQLLPLARRATDIEPYNLSYQNTLGAVLYRADRLQQAAQCLENNLKTERKEAAYDLYFLAMTYQRLGEPDKARQCFDRAKKLTPAANAELRNLRAETEALLAIAPAAPASR
jgi:tetratricopeptide (TPR) repeat protein